MKFRTKSMCAAATALAVAALGGTVPRAHATPTGMDRHAAVVAAAVSALREHAAALGFPTDGAGPQGLGRDYRVRPTGVLADRNGSTHVRMERSFRGLAVLGGDLVVHRAGDGHWLGASASFTHPLDGLPLTPMIDADAVARQVPAGSVPRGRPHLVIDTRHGPAALAWDVESVGRQPDGTPSHRHTYVDAASGAVRFTAELVATFLPTDRRLTAGPAGAPGLRAGTPRQGAAVAGTGHSLYAGDVTLATSRTRGEYVLKDPTRGGGWTVDAQNADDWDLSGLPAWGGTPEVLVSSPTNEWGDGTARNPQSAAVDAQYGQSMVWDYYHDVFGRSGVADDGVGVRSRVHFGQSLVNAFWSEDCHCVTYGDGDGQTIGPLVALDIVGHETTHGITAQTARLASDGESGGLNESTSDIFGTMVEFHANNPAVPAQYLIGSPVFLSPRAGRGMPKAIRYMDRPSRDGQSPDCWDPQVGELDPHLAAGIGNHFFYLLSEGSGRKRLNGIAYDSPTCDQAKLTGIGRDAAAAIWYRALTHYFTSATDYPAARTAVLAAATDLYGAGSAEANAVEATWDAVGVGPADDTR
jgi:Zn-dependent metalloprotease